MPGLVISCSLLIFLKSCLHRVLLLPIRRPSRLLKRPSLLQALIGLAFAVVCFTRTALADWQGTVWNSPPEQADKDLQVPARAPTSCRFRQDLGQEMQEILFLGLINERTPKPSTKTA